MQTETILLVEDNEDDILLTKRALRSEGIWNEVVVARDGVEALDYLFGTGAYAGRDPSQTPTFILLDLNLPRRDGIEVLRRLRADPRPGTVPVIVFTVDEADQRRIEAHNLGVNAYVRKPSNVDAFLNALKLGLCWTKV